MKKNPISIIIATYNGERFLAEQIESILLQDYPIDEIIVCDDNSTDNTNKILDHYQSIGKIKWIKNEKRLGVIRNFKKAASLAANGNYIAFCDQDDIWLSYKIKLQIEVLFELEKKCNFNKPALVYSNLNLIDQNGNSINKSFWNEISHDNHKHCLSTILFGNFITGCTILMNSKMLHFFSKMPENEILHDYWLGLISLTFGESKGIAEPLVLYRQHSSNVTYNIHKKKMSKNTLRLNGLRNIFKKNSYLQEELKIATFFYSDFKNDLNRKQKIFFTLFNYSKNMPYLYKVILRKLYFLFQHF